MAWPTQRKRGVWRTGQPPLGSMSGWYPPDRDRDGRATAVLTDQFTQRETTGGFRAVADADALVIAFSGRPDRVEVIVEAADVIVSLRDRGRDDADEITLRVGQAYLFRSRGDRVFARNAVALSIGTVQVIGEWA